MSDAGSPLGRYDDTPDDQEQLVSVQLLGLPLRVLAAGREYHDGLMREFRLMALSGSCPEQAIPSRLVELVDLLGRRYAVAADRSDDDVEAALDRGDDTIDLVYRVPSHVADAAQLLAALMDEADEFCRSEQLMTVPRSDVIAHFSRWYLSQFLDQVAGAEPTRWTGPIDDDAPSSSSPRRPLSP